MKVADKLKGMYDLETKGRVVYEAIRGLWNNEEYARYTDAYEKQLVSDIKKMGTWAKLCDMSEYKMSSVVDEISRHVKWCADNGLKESVCIVPSVIVKMQMDRSAKDQDTKAEVVKTTYFATLEEGEKYLKEKGYL